MNLNSDDPLVKLNRFFIGRVCFVAAMGGFLFGYDWVVIGGAKPFYESYFGIADSAMLQGLGMSSALFGCLLGAVFSGSLANRLGPKSLLICAAVLFVISAIGTAQANTFAWFCLFRIVGGIGIGLTSNLSPIYIAEIAPAKQRGQLVSLNQLSIVMGILFAQLINLAIAQDVPDSDLTEVIAMSWTGQDGWRWMFGAETVPALLFFVLLFFVPESPRWLVKAGETKKALAIMCRVGGEQYAREEVDRILTSIEPQITQDHKTSSQTKRLDKLLMLGLFLAIFQQWCGINVIFNYAQEIFSAAGYSVGQMMFNIVLTGIVNLVFTFVAILLVDKFGRRPLMLFGAAGLAAIYGILGVCYFFESQGVHMLVLVVAAIACYAMTLAPVTWVVISEIFPNRVRGKFVSICVFALWAACAILTFTFPYMNKNLGSHGTFWLYGGICLIGYLVIFFRLPETKKKSLEELELLLSETL